MELASWARREFGHKRRSGRQLIDNKTKGLRWKGRCYRRDPGRGVWLAGCFIGEC